MLLLNPRSRRGRRRKAGARRRHRRSARKMSAKQLKFFGPRKRRASRRRSVPMLANPSPRRGRRRSRRSFAAVKRRFRRNPISSAGIRASVGGITGALGRAAVGAAGAVVVDALMAQASRFLPVSASSRYTADGKMNPTYYGAKLGLALAVGVVGARFAPGRMRGIVARGVEGSLTVQGYDILRSMLPPAMLGFYNPGRVTGGNMAGMRGRVGRIGAYVNARPLGRLAASFPAGSAFSGKGVSLSDVRVGEGAMQ